MKKTFLTLSIVVAFTFQSLAQLSGAYTNRLQVVLDSVCNHYHIKGASAAVLVPGVGTWKGVHGVSYTGHNITSDMLFGIGSNTKTFVATTMLKLQEMGKVNLDDTIGTWIHGYPNINGQITIRQCLNHTSGLYSFTDNPAFGDSIAADFNRVWTPEEMLQFVQAPVFAAGTSWDYSNTNYIIAGIIIKQIQAQPINTILHDLIFTPQGLSNTIFFPADVPTAEVARPWSVDFSGANLEDLIAQYGYSNTSMFSAASTAGAIMQTAEDNAKFWHQLISGSIISNTSLNQMLQFVHIGYWAVGTGHDIGYGLGIFRYQNYMNGHTIYEHGGTNVGYINENMADSVTGVCLSVLTNQDSISNSILLSSVLKALHKVTITVSPTEIAEVHNTPSITIYPNPAKDQITLSLDITHPVQFMLYDMTGRCQVNTEIKENNTRINVSELMPGMYIGRITDNGTPLTEQRIQVIR